MKMPFENCTADQKLLICHIHEKGIKNGIRGRLTTNQSELAFREESQWVK